NFFPGRLTGFMYFNLNRRLYITISQKLHKIVFPCEAGIDKILQADRVVRKFARFQKQVNSTYIHCHVFFSETVLKAPFGDTALQGHLSPLKPKPLFESTSGALPVMSFSNGMSAAPRTLSAANTLSILFI